jgi:CelD/BcsL family acetyltransferase involved in cellulose biosynthesis
LQVTIVTDERTFAALTDAWNSVAATVQQPSVFLNHEWFSAAWAWRRRESTLYVLLAKDGERIVGILPLIRSLQRNGTRRLEFLSVPDTQLCDLIVAPGDAKDAAKAFIATLRNAHDWDILHLDSLRPKNSSIAALSEAFASNKLRFEQNDAGSNAFISLRGSWSDYYNARSRSLKKANNLAANRLHKAGSVRVHWVTATSVDDVSFATALEHLIHVSQRSWKRETRTSLDQLGPREFIERLSRAARTREWLSVWLLYLNDEPVAMEYQLIDGANVHALRADFDSKVEEISPGSYLFRYLLEYLFDRRLYRYYMGRGNNPYKGRWTSQGEPLIHLRAYNRTLRGALIWINETVFKPQLRTLRDYLLIGSKKARSSKDC